MKSKNELIIANDSNSEELSVAEKVFDIIQIDPFSAFKPTFFETKDLLELSKTSKTLYWVAAPELSKRELLTHVVLGEQDKAQAMIEKNPALLLTCSKAIDYSGRTIIGTAFQAAIGAGDKPMWEMILPYFEGLEWGEGLRQFDEQFPKGIKDDNSADELNGYYHALALAVIENVEHGLSAIERFRKEITSQKKITQGKHFNLQNLVAAYQAYINNFNNFAHGNNRDLFWQKVIGYLQRQMSAYDAQIYCFGVQSVLDNEKVFTRDLKFFNDGSFFFPLIDDSGLGFDSGFFGIHGARRGASLSQGQGEGESRSLKNYVDQKQTHLLNLESHLRRECSISPINCS